MTFASLVNILLVAFAFGFVIFWHELGHFLAARWAGVRVEQFAVGMGQALFSWRKGIGFRFGATQNEFDRRVDEEIGRRGEGRAPTEYSLRERYDIAEQLGMGETEYRLSWIPLGGYVKPTGQDDLRPAKEVGADDPKAFGAKPVGKRMVIISAGVVMNVILAFALYVGLFMHGFNAPPSVVGQVLPGSPADIAGLKPGDQILSINGKPQQDYQKLRMNIALLRTDEAAKVEVKRASGPTETIPLTPAVNKFEFNMPAVGVMQAVTLEGPKEAAADDDSMLSPDVAALPAGSRVVRVGDVDVSSDKNAYRLMTAINASNGRPVSIVVRYADGSEHPYDVHSSLMRRFGDSPEAAKDARSIGGMLPRVRMIGIQKDKPADKAGLKPGDVIEQMMVVGSNETRRPPTYAQFMEWVDQAGQAGKKIRLTVLRDGKLQEPIEIDPTLQLGKRRGIGAWPDLDLGAPVVAGIVPGTAVANTGIKAGDTVVSVNNTPTATWPDVLTALQAAKGEAEMVLASDDGSAPRTVKLPLGESDKTLLTQVAFTPLLSLDQQLLEPRKTSNPIEAAVWGYEETKEQIFNVYVTLRRLFEGRVPLSNLSGPVGIFTAGTAVASRGIDWLVWFTALISANLAVVNFLPIPIVDGGLFTFLVAEKITGRPPSPRVQTAAQIAGILLLGSLFLFVTYHDILRQWG